MFEKIILEGSLNKLVELFGCLLDYYYFCKPIKSTIRQMAHSFSPHTMTDGKFGPTPNGHYYMPMAYHNPSALKRCDKTRWALSQDQQYEVFEIADTPIDEVPCWMNDDQSGLYGMLDGCEMVLGKDNDERLAFFPKPGIRDT